MVSNAVREHFEKKYNKALELIKQSGVTYYKLGLFGSYARGDYKSTSDIDFVIITEDLKQDGKLSNLRWDLDDIDCDLSLLLPSSFESPNNLFSKCVVRDFKEIQL